MARDQRHERTYQVTVGMEVDIDPNRVEEWVKANFRDGDQVQVQNVSTGKIAYDNIGCDAL